MPTAPEAMRAVSPTGFHTLQFELVQVCLSQVQNVRMLKERHLQQSSSRAGSRAPLASWRRQRSAPLLGRSERPLCSSVEQDAHGGDTPFATAFLVHDRNGAAVAAAMAKAQTPLRSLACTTTQRQKRRVAPISSAVPRKLPQSGNYRRRSTSAGPFLRAWNTTHREALPPAEAAMRVQRWWRRIVQLQNRLFESLVKELLELRTRASREIQRTWRGSRVRRALISLGPLGPSRQINKTSKNKSSKIPKLNSTNSMQAGDQQTVLRL